MGCEAFAPQYLGEQLMLLLLQYDVMVTICCAISHLPTVEL